MRFLSLFATFALTANILMPAQAESSSYALELQVHNVKAGKGQLLVGVCLERDYLKPNCTYSTIVPVATAPQLVHVPTLTHGRYAVAIVYDKNKNKEMDTTFYGAPKEPVGFSHNKVGKSAAPAFNDVAFEYRGVPLKLSIDVY
jgi:uncharacterized protein (DUF2141 family)